jgi:hypothetical protein
MVSVAVTRRCDQDLAIRVREITLMSKVRLLFLILGTALSIAGVSACSASAKISFEWFVGKSLLKEKETRALTVNADSHNFDFHMEIPGVTPILFLSNRLTADNAAIVGGRPGASEETLLFENVTVNTPTGCTVETGGVEKPIAGTIAMHPLKTQIVEGQNSEVLILFTPKEGTALTTIKFLGSVCLLAGAEANLEGGFLGLPLPQKVEVLRQNIVLPSVEQKFLLASGGAQQTTGLTFSGRAVTLTGLTLLILTSDASFGPF